MKRIFPFAPLAAIVLSVLSLISGPVAQASPRNAHLSAQERAVVDAVSAWFNKTETLKGLFDQHNQDGSVVSGDFYLRRPGRMRFEYAEPQKLTLLSDGLWVMLNDTELESVDRYPLRETPLWLILKKRVDLYEDADVVSVQRHGEMAEVTVSEAKGAGQGALTLVFAGLPLEGPALAERLDLRHWLVEDVQGNRTLVSLKNLEHGIPLAPQLFIPDEYEFGEDED